MSLFVCSANLEVLDPWSTNLLPERDTYLGMSSSTINHKHAQADGNYFLNCQRCREILKKHPGIEISCKVPVVPDSRVSTGEPWLFTSARPPGVRRWLAERLAVLRCCAWRSASQILVTYHQSSNRLFAFPLGRWATSSSVLAYVVLTFWVWAVNSGAIIVHYAISSLAFRWVSWWVVCNLLLMATAGKRRTITHVAALPVDRKQELFSKVSANSLQATYVCSYSSSLR